MKHACVGHRCAAINGEFRLCRNLWLGANINLLGDFFNWVSLMTLVVHLSSSPYAVTGILLAETMPCFLFSGIAGVCADTFDRATIMIASNLVGTACCIGFIVSHHLEVCPPQM